LTVEKIEENRKITRSDDSITAEAKTIEVDEESF
jgi:hypothetical protein